MKYTKQAAIDRIVRNGGKVAESTRVIESKTPGIKVLGTIDYLVGQHKFHWASRD